MDKLVRIRASAGRQGRPLLVWLVTVWYVYRMIGYIIGARLLHRNSMMQPDQMSVGAHSDSARYAIGALVAALNIGGSVALVLRHRAAPWLFMLALMVSAGLSSVTISQWSRPGYGNAVIVSNVVLNFIVGIAVCLYAWHLRRKGYLYLNPRA